MKCEMWNVKCLFIWELNVAKLVWVQLSFYEIEISLAEKIDPFKNVEGPNYWNTLERDWKRMGGGTRVKTEKWESILISSG